MPCAACFFSPKKEEDLPLCKKWRGICLLNVYSKLLSSMLMRRLHTVMEDLASTHEEFGMDAQIGSPRTAVLSMVFLLRSSDFTNARIMSLERGRVGALYSLC